MTQLTRRLPRARATSRLRQEPDQKAGELAVALGNERGLPEVDEKELGEHVDHVPASPPVVEDGDHARVVGRLSLADFEPAQRGSVQEARHSGAG